MAVLRQQNFLGQQRVDVPHLRSIESASCGDFDMLVGRALGGAQALVVTGFDIANPTAAVGSAASGMFLNVSDAILINLNASESGSMFWQTTGTAPASLNPSVNTQVQGTFTPSTYNYIGIDLTRTADTSTSDLVEFLDPNTDLENPEIVPLARTLNYSIVISTATFASQPNLVPIAIVLTDGSNNVSSIQDARNLYGRLGIGGDSPNAAFQYTWPQGRAEDTDTNVFQGGDKAIGSQKDWMNATMSRIWEIGGGEYWYSQAADRNVTMITQGTPLVSDGLWFNYSGGVLSWTGITFLFDGSSNAGVYYNDVANNTGGVAVANGQCLYVILDRSENHDRTGSPHPALVMQGPVSLNTVGSGLNYADLQIVAWVEGGNAYARGQQINVNYVVPPATTTTLGLVELNQTPASSSLPKVLNLGTNNAVAWSALAASGADALTPTGATSAGTGGAGISPIGGAGATQGPAVNIGNGAGNIQLYQTSEITWTPFLARVVSISPYDWCRYNSGGAPSFALINGPAVGGGEPEIESDNANAQYLQVKLLVPGRNCFANYIEFNMLNLAASNYTVRVWVYQRIRSSTGFTTSYMNPAGVAGDTFVVGSLASRQWYPVSLNTTPEFGDEVSTGGDIHVFVHFPITAGLDDICWFGTLFHYVEHEATARIL